MLREEEYEVGNWCSRVYISDDHLRVQVRSFLLSLESLLHEHQLVLGHDVHEPRPHVQG